jgi:hypothetical protein
MLEQCRKPVLYVASGGLMLQFKKTELIGPERSKFPNAVQNNGGCYMAVQQRAPPVSIGAANCDDG